MTRHHLVRDRDIEAQCPYCNMILADKEFSSIFCGKMHYKHVICDCGKNICIRITDFISSGHDSWDKKRIKKMTIEEKIKKALV